ncbi:unnamed protein product [Bursaphelenchus okinawaensis]|uniref:Uncharacterized protein n=1 Tax=Bursaphelenchus okinawaensis TaxID=465554 RepID=A0A811KXL0_9BILA|nr:unnamed protein product [Bursaphelenchus okinawaensis]CAG9113901.1 unnamed protein product [Bursaphelenchus okinawaensis]
METVSTRNQRDLEVGPSNNMYKLHRSSAPGWNDPPITITSSHKNRLLNMKRSLDPIITVIIKEKEGRIGVIFGSKTYFIVSLGNKTCFFRILVMVELTVDMLNNNTDKVVMANSLVFNNKTRLSNINKVMANNNNFSQLRPYGQQISPGQNGQFGQNNSTAPLSAPSALPQSYTTAANTPAPTPACGLPQPAYSQTSAAQQYQQPYSQFQPIQPGLYPQQTQQSR